MPPNRLLSLLLPASLQSDSPLAALQTSSVLSRQTAAVGVGAGGRSPFSSGSRDVWLLRPGAGGPLGILCSHGPALFPSPQQEADQVSRLSGEPDFSLHAHTRLRAREALSLFLSAQEGGAFCFLEYVSPQKLRTRS